MYFCIIILYRKDLKKKKAKFWVDWLLEAGEANVCHRYWFEIELEDGFYEELYQVWFDNESHLNNWESKWDGHEELFEKIHIQAINALNYLVKQNEPDFANPIDLYWEISKETEDAF